MRLTVALAILAALGLSASGALLWRNSRHASPATEHPDLLPGARRSSPKRQGPSGPQSPAAAAIAEARRLFGESKLPEAAARLRGLDASEIRREGLDEELSMLQRSISAAELEERSREQWRRSCGIAPDEAISAQQAIAFLRARPFARREGNWGNAVCAGVLKPVLTELEEELPSMDDKTLSQMVAAALPSLESNISVDSNEYVGNLLDDLMQKASYVRAGGSWRCKRTAARVCTLGSAMSSWPTTWREWWSWAEGKTRKQWRARALESARQAALNVRLSAEERSERFLQWEALDPEGSRDAGRRFACGPGNAGSDLCKHFTASGDLRPP